MIEDDFDYLAPGGKSFTLTSGALARLNKNSRVLAIASGNGEAACALTERFGCKVEGFDLDPNMVQASIDKAAARGLDELTRFEVKDGRDADFGSGHYDLILAEGGGLTYVGREEGTGRCAALLKDGKALAITDLIYLDKDVPETVRNAYEEGVFTYLNEMEYRQLLERHGFEIVHLSLLPQSAWDRYYMAMRRRVTRPGGFISDEFGRHMLDEIDVFYNKEGMHYVGYVYIVAKMARGKRVKPGPKNLRVPVFGIWPRTAKGANKS